MPTGRCARGFLRHCSASPGSVSICSPTGMRTTCRRGAPRWSPHLPLVRWRLPSPSIVPAGRSRWSLPDWSRWSWRGSRGASRLRGTAMPTNLSGLPRGWSRSRWPCRCSRRGSTGCAGGRPMTRRTSMSGPMRSAAPGRLSSPVFRGCWWCCSPRSSPPSISISSRTWSTNHGSAGPSQVRHSAPPWACCATS